MTKHTKFLPYTKYETTFASAYDTPRLFPNLVTIKKNVFNNNDLTILELEDDILVMKLKAHNLYGFPPYIHIYRNENTMFTAKLYYPNWVRLIIIFWLFMCAIAYLTMGLSIVHEYFNGDGLVQITENGIQRHVAFFPLIPIITAIHFCGFFLFPATILTRGWNMSVSVINEIISKAT